MLLSAVLLVLRPHVRCALGRLDHFRVGAQDTESSFGCLFRRYHKPVVCVEARRRVSLCVLGNVSEDALKGTQVNVRQPLEQTDETGGLRARRWHGSASQLQVDHNHWLR